VGLYEMMDYTDDIKMMLLDGKSAFEIGKFALANGMIDLERDGLFKTIQGKLDLNEVYRFVKIKDR
jgi:type II secretory ATPase GspE/PulE/Tfp pilus assembly ATPase PilB-like protein